MRPFFRVLREIVAISVWIFIFTKLFVFDIDIYIFEKYLPSWRWMVNYRFFGLLAVIAIVLFGIRRKPFRRFLAYIVGYPLIILCWRIPKFFVRKWEYAIAFAPLIYDLIRSFRSRFTIVAVAALSVLCIAHSSNSYILLPSMVILGAFLFTHLFRSLRKAYGSSIFEAMGDLVKKLRVALQNGQGGLWKKEKYDPGTKGYEQQCLSFYLYNWFVEILGERLLKIAKRGIQNLYLMFSWLETVVLTTFVYGFEYWALYKADISSFKADYTTSFWNFLAFSFGELTHSNLSTVTPVSITAIVVSCSEVFCALIIVIILLFSLFTVAREKYREDISYSISEIHNLGTFLQGQFFQLYSVAVEDVEILLLPRNTEFINKLRKIRGLPTLNLPEKGNTSQ